ncbi:hypothetical protein, partial [Nonomuraea sp. NPDC059022]|uniref:hypothetical protein n=1 Tax=Nonomuraea sp. NPDC059022 TaxID=3346705 RepID=UPI0036C0FACA
MTAAFLTAQPAERGDGARFTRARWFGSRGQPPTAVPEHTPPAAPVKKKKKKKKPKEILKNPPKKKKKNHKH